MNPQFDFTGSVIIRFAVNCKNELGRIRMEVLDENAIPTNADEIFLNKVKKTFLELENWKISKYIKDNYTWVVLRFNNGKYIM